MIFDEASRFEILDSYTVVEVCFCTELQKLSNPDQFEIITTQLPSLTIYSAGGQYASHLSVNGKDRHLSGQICLYKVDKRCTYARARTAIRLFQATH